MRYILAFLLLCASLQAAITERYVSPAGSGTADGTSAANAMSLTTFVDYMSTGGSFTATAGDRFNVKYDAGGYARTTSTDTWVNGGSSTSPVIIRGYGTTITDGYQGRSAGGNLVTTNFANFSWTSTARLNVTGSWIILEACSFTSAANGDTILFNTGGNCAMLRCVVENSGTGASAGALALGTNGIALDCDINMTGGSGGSRAASGSTGVFDSCRFKVTQAVPAIVCGASAGTVIINNIIYGSGGIGISNTSTTAIPYIRSNTIVGCTGDGIDIITGTTTLQRIVGNMITDNSGNGIDMVSAANAGFLAYNRFRDNAASINSGTDWVTATSYGHVDSGTTGDTSTDYQNFGTNDFRLKATSPATSAGIPELQSIGAAQRDQADTVGGETSHTFVQ